MPLFSSGRLAVLALCLSLALAAAAGAQVKVDIYTGHTTTGGGAPFSGFVGSFVSPDIQFATNTGYAWHPFGLGDFGASLTGCLAVGNDGTYQFTLDSDDGSLLFINNALVVNNGGAHSPQIVSGSTFLAAGLHPFEVQFFEDFGGPSGLDLILPQGVRYAECPVPEPASMALAGMGLSALAGMRARRRAR